MQNKIDSSVFTPWTCFVLLLLFNISLVTSQTTIVSPSCGIDPSDPSRNILEITGNYASTIFNITSTIDNCYLYIHDLTVTSINISSPIINNSNITIRNVSSSNKSIATFIWIRNTITDFSFINISAVSHNSLSIDPSTGTDWISIVKFDGAITGKPDMTSWINISGLQMNDLLCDRTSISLIMCSSSMVYFGTSITNASSLGIHDFAMNNISMKSSSIAILTNPAPTLSVGYFGGSLNQVQKISLTQFVVRNLQVQNNAGRCRCLLLQFSSSITAGMSFAEFTVLDVVLENLRFFSSDSTSDFRLLWVNDAISNYQSIRFRNISAVSLNASSGINWNVYLMHVGTTITAPSLVSSTSLVIENIRFQNIFVTSKSASATKIFYVRGAVTNYSNLQIMNITCFSLNSISTTGTSSIPLLVFEGSITAPTDISSTFLANNIRIENVSSLGRSDSSVWLFYFSSGLSYYDIIRFSNLSGFSMNCTSISASSSANFLNFESSVYASESSPSSSFVVDHIQLEKIFATGVSYSFTTFVSFDGTLKNYNTISINNFSAVGVNLNSRSGISYLYALFFKSAISASSQISPSSSLIINNILVESASANGDKASRMYVFYVGSSVTNYSTVQFTDVRAEGLNAFSQTSSTTVFLLRFDSFVTGPPIDSSSSALPALTVENIWLENATSIGFSEAYLSCVDFSGAVSNFGEIRVTKISGISWSSNSSTESALIYLLNFVSSVTSPTDASSASSLVVENIHSQNASALGFGAATMRFVNFGGTVANFSAIRIIDASFVSWNSSAPTGGASIFLLYFWFAIAAPLASSSSTSFQIENIRVEQMSLSGNLATQMYLAYFEGDVNNFNEVVINNLSAVSLDSTSSAGASDYYLLRLTEPITAPDASTSSSLVISNVRLENSSSCGVEGSRMTFLSFDNDIANYFTIHIANITGLSLNSTSVSISAMSSIDILDFDASITGPENVISSSSPSLIVENVRLDAAECTGSSSSFSSFYVRNSVKNYGTIYMRNISTSNIISTSLVPSSRSTICPINFAGLSNCNILQVENSEMKNISSVTPQMATACVSSIILLSFPSGGNFENISKISLHNSKVEQITTASDYQCFVRLFDAGTGLHAEEIIINNNSLLLRASSRGTEMKSSPLISASILGIALITPGFLKMDATNNILSIQDQNWQEVCSPVNCSIVRVDEVMKRDNNNDTSTVSIAGNEISSINSSFISFANYYDSVINMEDSVLNFAVEHNKADFTNSIASSTSSFLGFSSPSLPFPPLVFIEMKCNRWDKTVDRNYEQRLFSIATSPSSQLNHFIEWSCRSHSDSESMNATSSHSSSRMRTPPTPVTSSPSLSPTVMFSMSTSHSIIRNSVSPLFSESKSSDSSASISISHSASSDRSRSATNESSKSATPYEMPSPFILKISESVNSALLASDGTQAAAMVSVAVFGSIAGSPALGFTIGRQQAMMDFAQKSLRGDCRGLLPSTTIKNFENEVANPLGLGDSPTQLSIGGSEKLMSYYVGAVIGNCLLIVGLVVLNQGIGMGILKFLNSRMRWIRKLVKKSKVASMMKERCVGFDTKKEPMMKLFRRVFAKSYVSLTLFFCLSFLLTPTLSSALIVLVAAKNDPKLENHQAPTLLKLASLVCAIVFLIVALYFVIWSVKLRNKKKEKYRLLKELLGSENANQSGTFMSRLFKAQGEWRYLEVSNVSNIFSINNNDKKKKTKKGKKYERCYNDFLIAEPVFESYRASVWFSIVEVATAIALAFPPFVAQFASSAKSSCLIHGITLLVILIIYTTILIWKNPFKLKIVRIKNPILSIQQLVVVAMSLVFVAKRSRNGDENNNDNGNDETPSWFWRIVVVSLGFESVMSMLMIVAAFFPIMMFLKKLRGRTQRKALGEKQ